eukprot:CAMPEP_0197395486 /NCGR_PEP_ID=MMETSP1165-20131217/7108_1 /TAXON_ID=284809 /ORGANISM="Chrysocystis fragilis, Strain CCMP3189" /LENGTH=318 /DNA_ID=CAMNT_0042921249 /DNA_START=13 /DNA_END=966 /DNA_ORIENTATION=+
MDRVCYVLATLAAVRGFVGVAPRRGATPRRALSVSEEASESSALVQLRQRAVTATGVSAWATQWWLDRRLEGLLARDGEAYGRIATRLHVEEGVARSALPNVENVGFAHLSNATFDENVAEKALLELTRRRYAARAPVPVSRSQEPGIRGLLDEMRQVAFAASPDAQRELVVAVLKDLATPVLPVFYRLVVAGCRPSTANGDPAWLEAAARRLPLLREPEEAPPPFYAAFLTAVVAPLVFSYLVGPATINRRADGALGGIVVTRCKFLQESGCKGLCLHQCKLPAQQLFNDDLKLPLYVKPNFDTLECQWSWGTPAPP